MIFIKSLENIINGIEHIDFKVCEMAQDRLNSLAKPLGSLGKLEDIARKIAGITGKLNNSIINKRIIIMCADNGVIEEGVSSCPQYVTIKQTLNFKKGITGVGALALFYNCDLLVVDVGVNSDIDSPNVLNRKIRKSTNNIAKTFAMTYEEAVQAINIGVEMVKKSKDESFDILGVGEMGIGNTSTSSAITAVLTGHMVEEVVGKGSGLLERDYINKINVIKKAIEINKPNKKDVIDVLSKIGGFDIAAMAGVFLGSAYYKIPVVIDGFISAVAALIAVRINPIVKEYLITSHASKEIGYKIIIDELGLEPMLNLDMRLGEGSGCPIAFSVVEASCAVMNNMATFEEADINDDYIDNVRDKSCYIVDR